MSYDSMNLAPLLCIIRASEGPLLLLIQGLLAAISMILLFSPISGVDLPIVLLS
jgi:hypothetical protein